MLRADLGSSNILRIREQMIKQPSLSHIPKFGELGQQLHNHAVGVCVVQQYDENDNLWQIFRLMLWERTDPIYKFSLHEAFTLIAGTTVMSIKSH